MAAPAGSRRVLPPPALLAGPCRQIFEDLVIGVLWIACLCLLLGPGRTSASSVAIWRFKVVNALGLFRSVPATAAKNRAASRACKASATSSSLQACSIAQVNGLYPHLNLYKRAMKAISLLLATAQADACPAEHRSVAVWPCSCHQLAECFATCPNMSNSDMACIFQRRAQKQMENWGQNSRDDGKPRDSAKDEIVSVSKGGTAACKGIQCSKLDCRKGASKLCR